MNKKEIEKIKKQLITKKKEILAVVSKNNEESEASIGDMIDIASDSIEKELMFELSDNERLMLDAIDDALQKIDSGNYGICETCGEKIQDARLNAMPFARNCIQCQAKLDTKR